jgi:hypothetical protein
VLCFAAISSPVFRWFFFPSSSFSSVHAHSAHSAEATCTLNNLLGRARSCFGIEWKGAPLPNLILWAGYTAVRSFCVRALSFSLLLSMPFPPSHRQLAPPVMPLPVDRRVLTVLSAVFSPFCGPPVSPPHTPPAWTSKLGAAQGCACYEMGAGRIKRDRWG